MLSIAEAQQLVLQAVALPSALRMPVAAAHGLTLAEEIMSTIDSPPYDKSLMDGFAVLAEDIPADANGAVSSEVELVVQEEIPAGVWPKLELTPGRTARIMTGAPLPPGTDAVIMLEESEPGPEQAGQPIVRLHPKKFRADQNLLRRAASMRKGETVLTAGSELTPAAIGLLAELGIGEVAVTGPPLVSTLSTGNELVPFAAQPEAGQIRNSNGPMLAAQIRTAGGVPRELGIARDDEEELRQAIEAGLQADILLLSGGVSAGDLDLVPGVLQSLGVRQVFHKVHLKPGKPLWFGVVEGERQNAPAPTLVFGLPGNPVSSFVCFELFVRPAMRKLQGKQDLFPVMVRLPLAAGYSHRGGRPVYLPAKLERHVGDSSVRILAWQGSADLRRLAEADMLVHLPAEPGEYQPDHQVDVLPISARIAWE